MTRSVKELETLVPVMRRLEVLEYDGIRLEARAPKAAPIELTEEQIYDRAMRQREMRRDIQFAASSIKPILSPLPRSMDHVVQRVANARERGSGQEE